MALDAVRRGAQPSMAWPSRPGQHVQAIDLGANHQVAREVRPAHDPTRQYGFLGVVVDTTDLEGSIWTWHRENGRFQIRNTATIPPEPADAALLPPPLNSFGAVPPLITDIHLSLDDRYLYAACWGTGELRQYDVTDPMNPALAGSVRIGGIGMARVVYRYLGLGFLRRAWLNRDTVWGASLVLAGVTGIGSAMLRAAAANGHRYCTVCTFPLHEINMLFIATMLTAIVIAIHVYIVLIETVLFRTRGRKVFGLKDGQVDALAPLMSNQGCYNGFLAAMLAVGLVHPNVITGRAFVEFGLVCVTIAGIWGAITVSRRILFVQTVPAALGLAAWLLA